MPTKNPRIFLTTNQYTVDRLDHIIALKKELGIPTSRSEMVRAILELGLETAVEVTELAVDRHRATRTVTVTLEHPVLKGDAVWQKSYKTLESPAVPPMERCVHFSTGPEEIQTSEGPGFPGRIVDITCSPDRSREEMRVLLQCPQVGCPTAGCEGDHQITGPHSSK